MKDPIIVSTGQTYERSCIQKWLDAGHRTCPKTQQTLLHTSLTPNYVLKSLIGLWCDSNGVELPKKQGSYRTKKSGSSLSDCDRTAIKALLVKLTRAIPLLVDLLSSTDHRTQEHVVTVLLNHSINESTPRGKKGAATAIFNLCIYHGDKARAVKAGIVAPLIRFMNDVGRGMVDKALAIMIILASHHEGRTSIGQCIASI
ncbi:E3 ubiquitin ligase PUB14 [Medicago truncatula]|uniref:RING-type E3 ubiquitin transferase n=1 Tax=Medicago truncatula TaxID=3880 RepID=A0A072VP90_MEDTR|nr:E3 ubiquitin ligase PUB14 [Medicago truncatula]